MAGREYIKIVINHPRRELFSLLQNSILYQNLQMFYLPNLQGVVTFVHNIQPDIFVTYIDAEVLGDPQTVELFNQLDLRDGWLLVIASREIPYSRLNFLNKFEKTLIFPDTIRPDQITANFRSLIREIQKEERGESDLSYKEGLLQCSRIIQQGHQLSTIFEKLIHHLPKILSYDYWAIFSYDPEFLQITNFTQFIPPHQRNVAIVTPKLEKVAEQWVRKRKQFRVNISENPALFRKMGEWGWGIKQLCFVPVIHENVVVGGILLGNTREGTVKERDFEFIRDLAELLADRTYEFLKLEKSTAGNEEFADQLLQRRLYEDEIIQLSCKKINEITRADQTIFWQVNRGFGFLFPKFIYTRAPESGRNSIHKSMLYLDRDAHLNQLIAQEQIHQIANLPVTNTFEESTLSTFKNLDYHHILVAPIRVQNEEIGVFIASRGPAGEPFTEWETDRVKETLEKIHDVLEDAHIVKEANQKLKQLSRIFELGNEIRLDLNLDEILFRITQSIRRTLGWNDVAVLRADNFNKIFKPVSIIGFDNVKGLPLSIKQNITQQKFEKFLLECRQISNSYFYDSQPVLLNGSDTDETLLEDRLSEWSDQDLLIVPIETKKNILGHLLVHDPVDRLKPTQDRVVALEYFANQAAVAIENSVLYERLLASEERYRNLAETMTLALVTCSKDGKILYLNPAFEELIGLERKSLIKKDLVKFFSRESARRLQEMVTSVLSDAKSPGHRTDNVELELLSANNESIPVSTLVFPFYQQRQKIGYFLVLNDLRVIKKLERLKADFNSMIVHDLRSPMNVIQGFIELIRTGVVGEINAEQAELLDIAKENVKKVLALIDNFLVASKMEVGRFSIEPKVGEINSLIQRIEENHMILAKNKNIELVSRLNPNLPLLYFDALRIEQVINNLLSNALKFTPENGKIEITSDFLSKEIKGENKMFARIGVHDSGPGIPPEEQKHIFEKYEQVDSGKALRSAGTGLGLSICKEIVHLHGGDIWVESVPGKGSHFYFTLPIEPSIDKFLK